LDIGEAGLVRIKQEIAAEKKQSQAALDGRAKAAEIAQASAEAVVEKLVSKNASPESKSVQEQT
jgi:hypothetical protein